VRIVVPRDARDHGYLALKVDGGRRGFGRLGRLGRVGRFERGWVGRHGRVGCFGRFERGWVGRVGRVGRFGCGWVGLGRGWFGGGARGDGELLGLLVLGGMLVLRLVVGRVVVCGRRPVSGGLLLVGQPLLGGLLGGFLGG